MNDRERDIDCEKVQQRLFELRDGTLGPAEIERVQAHLKACERCRATQAWDARLGELLREDDSSISPAGFLSGVRGRVRRHQLRAIAIRFAAAAAILLGLGLAQWQPWKAAREDEPIAKLPEQPPASIPTDNLLELAVLAEPPPVDSFEVLDRQQRGYVTVMRRLGEE
jgi:hypothetical protein